MSKLILFQRVSSSTNSAKLGYELHLLIDKRAEIQLGEVTFPRSQSEVDIKLNWPVS